LFIGATFVAMENHRTDSIPNDSYPVKSDRLLELPMLGNNSASSRGSPTCLPVYVAGESRWRRAHLRITSAGPER